MVAFEKIHACGNDFILLDEMPDEGAIRAMCDRHHHLGADGVMVFEGVADGVVVFRHFDSDGSASFCVNGTRAALDCLIRRNVVPDSGMAETERVRLDYAHREPDGTGVFLEKVSVQPTTWVPEQVPGYFCDVGNPHFVILTEMSGSAFSRVAPIIRHDRSTFSQGCNVSLVNRVGDDWHIRTFERGVEGFTKACGSAVMASALALQSTGWSGSLRFVPPGGDWIRVDDVHSRIALWGPTRWVASGVMR